MKNPAETVQAVTAWTRRHPHAVLFDEDAGTLLDVASGKRLAVPAGEVKDFEERTDAQTGGRYLILLREDDVQVVLADVGIAWPPSFASTGPIAGLPQAVCWRDFERVVGHLEHLLSAHPDEAPGREAVDLVNLGIAILDGARILGFDVGPEEKRLEGDLETLERRVRGGGA